MTDIADWFRDREYEATKEILRLRGVLRRYTCECSEPCFFYDAEEAKAGEMPNPPCGWWAREVLG